MNFPQGPIWQSLRQQALDVVPLGSQVNYAAPLTLRLWQTQGAYTVTRAAAKEFEIVAFSAELGGVMLTEAEHYLDHAAEHQALIFQQLDSAQWTSPAWQAVTVYYWAYFVLLAVTRLLGDTIWFVDDVVAAQLSGLAPHGGARVGPGSFRLTCGTSLSATERQVLLKRQKGRAHDALWSVWAGVVGRLLAAAVPASGSDEERFFTAIARASSALGTTWPSDFRNLTNYRPGFAYGSVRNSKLASSLRHMDSRPVAITDVLYSLEDRVASLDRRLKLPHQAGVASRILADYTFLLNALARALYEEVVDRTGIDKRWRRNRSTFLERRGVCGRGSEWPCV